MKNRIVALRQRPTLVSVIFFLCICAASGPASATLLGDNFDYKRTNPAGASDTESTGILASNLPVDFKDSFGFQAYAGGVFPVFIDVNINASSIHFSFDTPDATTWTETFGQASQIIVSDLDWVGDPSAVITGIDVTIANVTGLFASDFTFNNHSIILTASEQVTFFGASEIWIEIEGSHSVPTPGTILLLMLGILGIGHAQLITKAPQ